MRVAGVTTLVLLAGCATTPTFNEPLTAWEKEVISRINPAASIVTKLQGQTIEVSNFTMPAGEPILIFGEKRLSDVAGTLNKSYRQIYRVYEPAAERHCASFNQWPDKGIASGTHSMRFTCYEPKEWAFVKMREGSQHCEGLLRPGYDKVATQINRNVFQTSSGQRHPCVSRTSNLPWLSPPAEFCNAYTDLTKTSPSSEQTCAEYVGMAKRLEMSMSENQVQSRGSVAGRTIEGAKQECTDLGFSPKTEKHADCVLRLTK